DWTFAHGIVTVAANVVGGALPDSVQLYVDGTATGPPVATSPYTLAWDTTQVADGSHTLSVKVTDAQSRTATSAAVNQTGDSRTSAAVSFAVGSGPPTVVVTVPRDWTFVSKAVPVTATVTGGTAPLTGKLLVDGLPAAVVPAVVGSTFTFPWDTTTLIDGS